MNSKILQNTVRTVVVLFAAVVFVYGIGGPHPVQLSSVKKPLVPDDTGKKSVLKYPVSSSLDPLTPRKNHSFDLSIPDAIETHTELDTSLSNYRMYNTIGGIRIGEERIISLADYIAMQNRNSIHDYFKERSQSQNFLQREKGFEPKINIKTPKVVEDIIGGNIDIKPQGMAELSFSYDINRISNPAWTLQQQRNSQFKFDQKIKLNVRGSIGDKIGLGIGYDTESNFEFDNEIKLRYEGKEDDIVKLLEAGNVSLPVQGTLITGSTSLFGVKSKLQFGKLMMTNVFSQQKSEKKEIIIENGAQKTTFNISSLEYDANKHFFLNQYFRNYVYEQALKTLPVINSPIQITRVEVWVINRTADFNNTRNLVAFMDLGEPQPYNSSNLNPDKGDFVLPKSDYPDNGANTLFENIDKPEFRSNATVSQELSKLSTTSAKFYNGQDYIKIDNARKLNPNEYTINDKLGYISLNQRLDPGYALAVAYEYTFNGVRYQVGEFSQDVPPDPNNPNVLFVKMLKSTSTRTDIPMWDLMMKNIYSLGSSQIQPNEFKLDIIYEDDKSGANLNYIPESAEPQLNGKLLIQVLNLDNLNSTQHNQPDGIFDFIDGITINSGRGLIIFPTLEPFGSTLRKKFIDQKLADYYCFDALYDSTQVQAEQLKQFDKFYIRGYYLGSSGAEISLNAIQVPEGSVTVSAGGMQLRENIDYTVDYTLGRVKIINQSVLNSGQPIKVTCESNSLFTIQQKTLIGTRLDYKFSEDFFLGGTLLYLKEKPLTQKVNIGTEPLNNVIYGFDGSYRTDSRFLTKLVDRIPLIETKEMSEILITGEFAQIIPGHPKAIGPSGTSYIDDFEGSEIPYDLRMGNYWSLASTPQGQPIEFPYGQYSNDLRNGYRRAKLSWYSIDDLFYRGTANTPKNIDTFMLSRHRMREVLETELFPFKQMQTGMPSTLRTFDLAYFPSERGPYNYDYASLDYFGKLKNPKSNWGGIMRKIETNDFEAANIEYIEFWLLDPYLDSDFQPDDGKLIIHLGDISEDVLRDGAKFFENGLPKDTSNKKVNNTIWGKVPTINPINYAFDNDQTARDFQDVGLDGLSDNEEYNFRKTDFIDKLPNMDPGAKQLILDDPSADNYHFFRGDDLDNANADIIERYKNYRNTEGNSPIPTQNQQYSTTGTLSPDVEDANGDFTLNEIEAYYEYDINLHPNMTVGENFIVDKQVVKVKLRNGSYDEAVWYQFKIPIRAYDKRIGQIRDFKSIRFMRMILTDFEKDVVLRFGRLQLVRGDWRQYLYDLKAPGEVTGPGDPIDSTIFDISTVNIEANGKRDPIPYVLPPGIIREQDISTYELLEANEQSLSFSTCLPDGEARAAYKNVSFDVRTYKRLRMFVHAEAKKGQTLNYGDLSLFVRMGTDFSSNYYEYEIPLKPTPYGTSDAELIWDTINEINILFEEFFRVRQLRETTPGSSLILPFTQFDKANKGRITVLGNPDLSNVKVIMIGVRNPSKDNSFVNPDNGEPHCGIIWINELRVTDFDQRGGYAAIGKIATKLADFGKVNVSGSIKTVGFGSLEQKLQDRSKEDLTTFDVQTYLELGKFFPQKAKVKIPMFYNYSQSRSKPQYNPLAPDILLKTRLDLAQTREERDSILYAAETFISRTSLNFMNVQKMRNPDKRKFHFYDIENVLLSYAYNDVFKRDINAEYDFKQNHQFILNYNYTFKEKNITPFRKVIKSKSKYLRPITDFNIGLIPQSFSFQTQIDRRYGEMLYRNNTNIQTILTPLYEKNFTIKRIYEYRHDFTRSLKLVYNASVDAYVYEPAGPITPETRDTILRNFSRMGNTRSFDHKIGLSYDIPLRKFPVFDWINARASYTGSYNWREAPPAAKELGNTIQNAQTTQLSANLNFVSLYGKIKFFKNINANKSNIGEIRKKRFEELKEKYKKEGKELVDENGEKITAENIEVNEGFYKLLESSLRFLMSLKNATINYSLNQGTILPGYDKRPQILGNNWDLNAPGLPFLAGIQDPDFRFIAARNGWLTRDTSLNTLYMQNYIENLTVNANLEPFKDFRINVEMNRQMTKNFQEIFRYDEITGDFVSRSPVEGGSFSMSYWSLPTALKGRWNEDKSQAYQNFEDNRHVIAHRLSPGGPVDTFDFPAGYTRTSQDVIIPAFLAAYAGKNAMLTSLSNFPAIPAPNWRITYSGLSKVEWIKKYIKNINLNHAYRSSYNVSNFTSNLNYDENEIPVVGKNLIPKYRIQTITITEQLAPLLGLDINWVNNWTSRIEYRTTRNISFTFANYQTAEIRDKDLTIGIGYRAKEVQLPSFIKYHNKKVILENDLNFRLDFTLRTNRSVIYKLDENETQNVGGSRVLTLKPYLDYVINDNLTIRLFFNRNVTKPVVSTSYPTSFTNFGFSVRYTLGQ
ncbi:MAG TPA: cell surface protein SprA [Bacteroidia bacterium]|nr:cell surface protein SprA [Bacteroidia bacterium]HRU67007.1 cell surface protein SprA [Bacteroidia bacterium]